MMDWNTYLTTRHNSGQPIIKLLDPAISYGTEQDDALRPTPGVQIGRVINVVLLLGLLLYFCSAR
ncbi:MULTISPECIES: hypothetical protein [Sphingobium]|uniref:Uncharacterized protein n=1 Tax=Sphingobium chungbukense TaxID=56193 RepID=A0A0M3AL35_9SPHN|nr:MULTISPECIES: hypothetical protein [Sphingobium]AMK26074.1 hypothetical protein K426_25870 [Sphingobium sp. TKS]KKW90560.1 hypothetical protein YP76_18370 [Sphingobium chungbukense]